MTNVRLGDIVAVRGGGTPRKSVAAYYGGSIPWVTPKDMKRPVISTSAVTLTDAGVSNSPAKLIPADSVLVVVRSGVLKHTLPVALTSTQVTVNQDMKALIPGPHVYPPYLARWVNASGPKVLQSVRATTADNFPIEVLLGLELDLPPLPEQRRIAAILDQADELRAKRRRTLTLHDDLTQSIFLDMFGTSEFPSRAIREVADVRSGSTPSRSTPGNFGKGVPWVKTGEVQRDLITATEESVTEQGVRSARLRMFPKGSVVVAMYGQGRTRGQSAVLGIDATTNQACAVILPNDKALPQFLHAQLQLGYERLRAMAQGGNQANLSLGLVSSFAVLLPPIDLQHEFVRRVESARAVRRIAEADQLGELFASLQSRAFAGQL